MNATIITKDPEFGRSTYFRTREISPFVNDDNEIVVYEGRGTGRSWGAPQVTSSVTELNPLVIQVNVTGWHKHSVSPEGGNYYFVLSGNDWKQTTRNNKRVRSALGIE